jgi:hypothetical protein
MLGPKARKFERVEYDRDMARKEFKVNELREIMRKRRERIEKMRLDAAHEKCYVLPIPRA